jgi:hypothetical protein
MMHTVARKTDSPAGKSPLCKSPVHDTLIRCLSGADVLDAVVAAAEEKVPTEPVDVVPAEVEPVLPEVILVEDEVPEVVEKGVIMCIWLGSDGTNAGETTTCLADIPLYEIKGLQTHTTSRSTDIATPDTEKAVEIATLDPSGALVINPFAFDEGNVGMKEFPELGALLQHVCEGTHVLKCGAKPVIGPVDIKALIVVPAAKD